MLWNKRRGSQWMVVVFGERVLEVLEATIVRDVMGKGETLKQGVKERRKIINRERKS